MIQAARDIGTVQYKLQNATLIIPDYLVTKICPHKLISTIYCISWSRLVTLNFAVCMWCLNLPIDISMTFILWHHVKKGTRISHFLLSSSYRGNNKNCSCTNYIVQGWVLALALFPGWMYPIQGHWCQNWIIWLIKFLSDKPLYGPIPDPFSQYGMGSGHKTRFNLS